MKIIFSFCNQDRAELGEISDVAHFDGMEYECDFPCRLHEGDMILSEIIKDNSFQSLISETERNNQYVDLFSFEVESFRFELRNDEIIQMCYVFFV